MAKYHGHKTMADGTHVPLTEAEADALWQYAKDAEARRAEAMPTAQDALRTLVQAEQRLNELGWWKGGGLRVRRGDECAVAETGSSGIWRGRLDETGKYVHYCDCVSDPRKLWLKPLADLTDDEREHMHRCDKAEAEAYSAMVGRFAAPSEKEGGR